MSTPFVADDLRPNNPTGFTHTTESLHYAVTHTCLPRIISDASVPTAEKDLSLVLCLLAAVHAYVAHTSRTSKPVWSCITKMLDSLLVSFQSEHLDKGNIHSLLREMQVGDTLVFLVRSHSSALIITRQQDSMMLELFEVSSNADTLPETAEPSRAYPACAIKIANELFDSGDFQTKLADILSHPDALESDHHSLPPHAQYIALLSDIFQDAGGTADVPRVVKRVRDHVCDSSTESIWRRSSAWLLVKVAIQMSLERSPLGRLAYKTFMLFFICAITTDKNLAVLPSDLLHSIGSKIIGRLKKLDSSIPDWLSQVAQKACARLREIYEARSTQLGARSSPFRNPSQEDLIRDTRLSLKHSGNYIRRALANHPREPVDKAFHPSCRRRGTLDDFLSPDGKFFDEAYEADPEVTIYDVEQAVEHELDDWLAGVTDVDMACMQVEILMDKYMTKQATRKHHYYEPEAISVTILTGLELFVALDKLVLGKIPFLADYSPEISLALLERLLLRSRANIHHFSRVYLYLSARHSQSRPGWSVLSEEFTENSFAIRYYDQSALHQQLRSRIEKDDDVKSCRLPLFNSLLHAKIIAFELQCPPSFRTWRCAIVQILLSLCRTPHCKFENEEEENLLARDAVLQCHFVDRDGPSHEVNAYFSCFIPTGIPGQSPAFRYAVRYPKAYVHKSFRDNGGYLLSIWRAGHYRDRGHNSLLSYRSSRLSGYVNDTSHTSNDVLAAQTDCPRDLSLEEFVTFGQLRSGGSLQWLNILRGLRNRTLNIRHWEFHYLLSHAISQVGPLNTSTGASIWHEDLQELSFCSALLDELENTFVEVGDAIDGIVMNTISMLLARVLASSPSEDVSKRVISFLRRVCRKTFGWIQELSYSLSKAPTNSERKYILLEMAVTCQSVFDVEPSALRGLFQSAGDVDAALSSVLFIRLLSPKPGHVHGFPTGSCINSSYSLLLCQRGKHLCLVLERTLGDMILVDVSDFGIDLAVSNIFPRYKPNPRRWERLHHPNTHWFTCKTKDVMNQPSQTVYLNLLKGDIRVDGRTSGGLASMISHHNHEFQVCKHIFDNQGFFVVPSSLPGMDFTTHIMTSEKKVHFSVRSDGLVIRVQNNQSKDILELIPLKNMEEDLPVTLVRGHAHWLNLSTKIIEIRPLERLWEESPGNWRIDFGQPPGQYRAYKGQETLVSIGSPTWAMASRCFEPFDIQNIHSNIKPNNLLVSTFPVENSCSAVMPLRLSVASFNYGLSFSVNSEEELESNDFKNMVYDENQYAGTLLGLKDLLILRQKSILPQGFLPNLVLIPTGYPIHCGDHQFRIAWNSSFPIGTTHGGLYHTYSVDTELGCLVGNGSTSGTGYLAHLYATTSCDWPDLLTGETGAQTALCLFRSGACRSIMKYKALNISAIWASSSRYPEIRSVLEDIQLGYYWDHGVAGSSGKRSINEMLEKCSARREDEYRSRNSSSRSPRPDNCIKNEHFTNHIYNHLEGITLHHLLINRSPPLLPPPRHMTLPYESHRQSPDHIPELKQLFPSLPMKQSNSLFSMLEQEYVAHLEKSAQCIREASQITHRLIPGEDHIALLQKYFMECRHCYFGALAAVKQSLSPTSDPYEQVLNQFGQWPPVTGEALLRFLTSSSPIELRREWKRCLISLALLLLGLQRARRLLQYGLAGQDEELSKELDNEGCDGWDPEEFPDWLLIQIQGNFLIRRTQAEVAKEMISPRSGENTVMQVNMGEGKSSVIIPIVAAALANGKQLVRVVVPKPLKAQMFDLLVARLGRLTNRPIYYLPFMRSPDSDDVHRRFISLQVDSLQKFMAECMANHGILLVQPEHIASLKLMSVMKQIDQDHFLAGSSPLQGSIYKNIPTILMEKQLSKDSFLSSVLRPLRRPTGNSNDFALADNRSDGSHSNNASKWFNLHKWVHTYARDILDESDVILRPRFQLIYTVGNQQYMDGYPDRWIITQQVLQLVKESADTLSKNHPNCIEYKPGPPGSFPHIRIVRASAISQRLIPMVVEDVMAGRLSSINIRDVSNPSVQCAIRSFISDKDACQIPDTVKRVEEYARRSDQRSLWNCLLLLRGLLTSNILLFTLTERRWRVDYGLILPSRLSQSRTSSPQFVTMLAVPFRAKDVPAPNTQFGHPDVTIILTCLSYYYDGLTEGELRTSFEILLDEDDPTTEYMLWVKEYSDRSMPDLLWTLGEINLKPSEQWDKIVFPLFARNQAAINFYLSRVVFPKEAKQYPWKLSSSSWDLAEKREKLVTGFSGTNDIRWLLPKSIVQHSLQHEYGTNAKVLAYLLRPENNFYHVAVDKNDSARASTVDLLQMISEHHPKIRVLVDAGAQILDLSNEGVAKAWLKIERDVFGVIFFNSHSHELVVLPRLEYGGSSHALMSSPLLQHLDRCVVYLDHAHTRGTDIKLPIGSRAAVTLGPKLTKDDLVQACMRMRKLGHGHSVMFFAPPEVDASIRSVTGKRDRNVRVNVADVLCWAIHETWTDIQQQAPHWAQQGMDHRLRYNAWSRYCNNDLTLRQLSDAWLQNELKSLDELYIKNDNNLNTSLALKLNPDIHRRCKDLGIISLPSACMDEEQEREVQREKEREREAELPPKAEPTEHILHHDVTTFVKTGVIPPLECTTAFCPIFTTLDKSSATSVEADVWSPFILATTDFCNTIKPESTEGTIDQYLRPVQWILSSKRDPGEVLVLISPFEADRLMAYIRESRYVHLHLYAPRMSKRMKPSDDLTLHSIPPLPSDWTPSWALIDQLNVFAGQLYLRDYNSYLRLCHFLGEPTKDSQNDETLAVRRNIFKVPGSFEENEIMFSGSPLPFVMELLAIRTRGKPFAHTHMGRILYGQPLTARDFDGSYAHSTAESDQDSSLPFSSDMDDDSQEYSGTSGALPPKRRKLVGFDASDIRSERPRKRRCSKR